MQSLVKKDRKVVECILGIDFPAVEISFLSFIQHTLIKHLPNSRYQETVMNKTRYSPCSYYGVQEPGLNKVISQIDI